MEFIMKPTESASKPSSPKKRKLKMKAKSANVESKKTAPESPPVARPATAKKPKSAKKAKKETAPEDPLTKYPILQNEQLIEKFLKVQMTNNQKGRIRQAIKDSLQGTSNAIVPDIVHNKIQSILQSSDDLTDSQLRRIRILYNLLKTSLKGEKLSDESAPKPAQKAKQEKKKEKKAVDSEMTDKDDAKKDKKEPPVQKVKGPKRYVVFLGNLPLDVDKEKIMNHFREMNEQIKDIRIPKIKEGKKSAIAFVELTNEPSYEFALSKHHSMMGTKRINVLYTTQKNGKISKGDAKSKSAKLIALQKSGKLVGSLPLAKKRSQRRLKLKQARAKEQQM